MREGANYTQELHNPNQNASQTNENSPAFAVAESLGRKNMLKIGNTDASLESSGMSSHRPPVVHVTKYGERIDVNNRCDSGFLNLKLEQAADVAFASSNAPSSDVASDPSFNKDARRRKNMMEQYKTTSAQYKFPHPARDNRLH